MVKKLIEHLVWRFREPEFLKRCDDPDVLEVVINNTGKLRDHPGAAYLGSNPHLTASMIEKIHDIDNTGIRKNLAKNPATPECYLDAYADDRADVRAALARRPGLPEHLVLKLVTDKLPRVVEAIEKRPELNAATARQLILASCRVVKATAALRELLAEDPRLATQILKQPACNAKLRAEIEAMKLPAYSLTQLKQEQPAASGSDGDSIDVMALETGKQLTELYRKRPDLGTEIVKNPACGKALLKKLVVDLVDISMNPKLQLELMIDPARIGDYLPKGWDSNLRIATHTPCQALQQYYLEQYPYSGIAEHLAKNPNLPEEIRREGLKIYGEAFLCHPGLSQAAVDRWFADHLDKIEDYAYLLQYMHHGYRIPDALFKTIVERIYRQACDDNPEAIRKYEKVALKKDGNPSVMAFRAHASMAGFPPVLGALRLNRALIADVRELFSPLHYRIFEAMLDTKE